MAEALPTLKPDRIAGVGGLATRHDSMAAGEAGADYVLFGEPDAQKQRPSIEAIAERLQWWAELFEPPCVGFAASRDEAGMSSPRRVRISFWSAISSGPIRAGPQALMDRAGDPAGACRVGKNQSRTGITPE